MKDGEEKRRRVASEGARRQLDWKRFGSVPVGAAAVRMTTVGGAKWAVARQRAVREGCG